MEEKLLNQQKVSNLVNKGDRGGYSDSDIKKTERNAIMDLHSKTDYHGDIINSIAQDIKDSHGNLITMNREVKSQGEQIARIHVNVQDTGTSVKRADKNITIMQRRAVCQKLLLHILAVVLFLAIIIVFILKLAK